MEKTICPHCGKEVDVTSTVDDSTFSYADNAILAEFGYITGVVEDGGDDGEHD